MQISFNRPPMFDAIDAEFKIANKSVIFAWGHTIYNPQRVQIPPALIAHEAVHGQRQGKDIELWWERYIKDLEFRLAEEIPAHIAEYRKLLEHNDNRRARRFYLKQTAKRLAHPLYGNLITVAKARETLIKGGK